MHENFITCMVKHRSLMYNKNVKKTFEIMRSEITFLMDLWVSKQKMNVMTERLLSFK